LYYDPIKRSLGNVFNRSPWLRRLFYHLLDLLLLRTWHVHRELRQWAKGRTREPIDILDAGAGYGQYSYWLSSLSSLWRILAVDVKEEQVAPKCSLQCKTWCSTKSLIRSTWLYRSM
jgi:2-polyprenyl-3-methyl-5-hydroxy-6-metoxy-1,4-benzoquinol methylase